MFRQSAYSQLLVIPQAADQVCLHLNRGSLGDACPCMAHMLLTAGAGDRCGLQHHRGAGICRFASQLSRHGMTRTPSLRLASHAGTAEGWVHASQVPSGQRCSCVHAHPEAVLRLRPGSHGHTSLSGARLRQLSSGGVPVASAPAQVRACISAWCSKRAGVVAKSASRGNSYCVTCRMTPLWRWHRATLQAQPSTWPAAAAR